MKNFEAFEKEVDNEIERRSRRGEILQREIPAGVPDFETFVRLDIMRGMDFITVNEAWEAYQKRTKDGERHSEGSE